MGVNVEYTDLPKPKASDYLTGGEGHPFIVKADKVTHTYYESKHLIMLECSEDYDRDQLAHLVETAIKYGWVFSENFHFYKNLFRFMRRD